MKKLTVIALAVTVLMVSGSAMAYERKVWDDLSWWGNSGATPDPVEDKFGRSGYWWWPTDAASNVNDSEAWGNRGVVYYAGWQPMQDIEQPQPPPPPPPAEPAKATWTKPVLNHVLFDFDKSVLKPEGQAATNQVVQHMNEWPNTVVTIEGHTCSVGTDAYNMGLGQRRADSVKKYMLDAGIDAARVNTVSFGESQPAVPNDTPANRKLNRRAVFDVTLGN
jgi:outer membrane protein OmpA-like peptidoglycan-associated protein